MSCCGDHEDNVRRNWEGRPIVRFEVEIPIRISHPDHGIPVRERAIQKRTLWDSFIVLGIDAVDEREAVEILTKRLAGLSDEY